MDRQLAPVRARMGQRRRRKAYRTWLLWLRENPILLGQFGISALMGMGRGPLGLLLLWVAMGLVQFLVIFLSYWGLAVVPRRFWRLVVVLWAGLFTALCMGVFSVIFPTQGEGLFLYLPFLTVDPFLYERAVAAGLSKQKAGEVVGQGLRLFFTSGAVLLSFGLVKGALFLVALPFGKGAFPVDFGAFHLPFFTCLLLGLLGGLRRQLAAWIQKKGRSTWKG